MPADPTPQSAPLEFFDEHVYDTREVHIKVEGAPLLTTKGGKTPIEPYSVNLSYSIPTATLRGVRVLGKTYDDRGRRKNIRRWVETSWAPDWLLYLIEEYRP